MSAQHRFRAESASPSSDGPPVLLAFPAEQGDPGEQSVPHIMSDPERGEARALIAHSEPLLEVVSKARRIARSKIPVLIQGENGTGKELLARLIHDASPRRGKPLVQVNCAALSETLVESELFGHEKGAFTGAERCHTGYFERAHEGSLLLDEIGEMPAKLQAKLLRVLEEEAFERVGGERLLRADVRVIATTNRDLAVEVARGEFRRDLFYRLNAMPLHVLPLRTRPQDIPPLVRHFIERYGEQGAVQVTAIAPAALEHLIGYSWPGNVRQLRNVIHHACVLAERSRLERVDLPPLCETPAETIPIAPSQTLAEIERDRILDTLRQVGGNRTVAAVRLGVTVRTLQNKLKRYRDEHAA